uniref:Secreted protein n=1 Tax=Oryza glaberrima TaxID=4538 RepID=I1QX34_ORYGL
MSAAYIFLFSFLLLSSLFSLLFFRPAAGELGGGEEAGTTMSRVTDMRTVMASTSSLAGAAFPWQTGHEAWDESHMSMHS